MTSTPELGRQRQGHVCELLYASLMLLLDFPESPAIIVYSQYAEGVVLHIESGDYITDNSELTLSFMQLQQTVRSGPFSTTHIQFHTGLPRAQQIKKLTKY